MDIHFGTDSGKNSSRASCAVFVSHTLVTRRPGWQGSFYLPPDPRSDDIRRADAAPGRLEERFFGGSRKRLGWNG